ncbi:amidohydrolase [Pseudactinotalea sp. Z1748]|uniref:amidohydrolase n=1 Tax=Pseudactinotalea sp. Z1748 TaxID=3413027 RepID=UPI003C7E3753
MEAIEREQRTGDAPLVIRRVRLPGPVAADDGAPGRAGGDHPAAGGGTGEEVWDAAIADGRVAEVVPTGHLEAPAGSAEIDAEGRYLLPGLWDEHTHMVQWALAMSRLDLSGATSAAQVMDLVRSALPTDRPVVGYGFRDALWPDVPSRDLLDQVAGAVPVVLVSGDLHCAWVNTAGADLLRVAVGADGLVREGAWFEAMPRLDAATVAGAQDALANALPLLAARGVVGVVDLEWADNISDWRTRLSAAVPALVRVEAGIYPDRLPAALAEGWRSGQVVPGTGGLVRVGPLKILSDGSLNTRTALCRDPYRGSAQVDRAPGGGYGYREYDVTEMVELLRRAAGGGITATVHAIGDLAVTAALDAFEATGSGGRIEHAQLVHPSDHARFAALGVVAGVQPEHAMDDRDLAEQYWPERTGWCFPLADLARADATIRLGSDAPVAPLDPWVTISAAVTRSRDGREPWHPEQALPVSAALAASARGRARVRTGQDADLVLTDADPHTADPQALRTMPVWATMVAGRWTHGPT